MRTLPAMLAVALVCGPLAASGGTESGDDLPDTANSNCSLQLRAKPGEPRRALFRLRCDFMVTRLTIDASRRVSTFSRTLRLTNPDPEDRPHTCKRTGDSQIYCEGEAGQDVDIAGAMRVRGAVCTRPRLGLKVRAEGGNDCDDPSRTCLLVGLRATRERKRPAGC